MSIEFEENFSDWLGSSEEEIKREIYLQDPVEQRCRFVSFISRSSGRGRKRKPREVNLLVVDKRIAYQVIRGEIKGRKSASIHPDILALEVLSDEPWEERSANLLLQRALINAARRR